jgi:pimeloyl-ACP methyl ester carboxylesterase
VLGTGAMATQTHPFDSVAPARPRSETSAEDGAFPPLALDAAVTFLDTASSGRIACYRDDRGDDAPVVLVHSVNAAASAYEMRPLFEHYQGYRPVYALDLPGFGASSRDDAKYTPQRFIDAIERVLIDVVDAEQRPATVVALSLSCEFAAGVAIRSSRLIRSLVHLSPTGLDARPRKPGRFSALQRTLFHNDWVARGVFPLLASRPSVRYFLSKSFVGSVPQDLVEKALAASHVRGARHAPAAFLSGELFTPDALQNLYLKVEVPQLVVYDKDAYSDFGAVPRLVADNSDAFEEVIAPSRGMAHWEHTARVLDAIRVFEASAL